LARTPPAPSAQPASSSSFLGALGVVGDVELGVDARFLQAADEEVAGHRAGATKQAGHDLFLVHRQRHGLAHLDVGEGLHRGVDGHVHHFGAWQEHQLQVFHGLDLGDEVAGHAEQRVHTAGLEFEEGGGVFVDLAQRQALDLGRPGVLGQYRGPAIVFIAHQHGLLADIEALQLEGAAAHGGRDAELVAQGLVGLG
jgi:hypothetical protein